jgi:hypothetical protein
MNSACAVLYCHLWPVRALNERQMWVLISSTTFVWNISHSKNNRARCDRKCVLGLVRGPRYSCHILAKLWFSRQTSEKYWNINVTKIRPVAAELFACGRLDRRTWRSPLIVAFLHYAIAPEMKLIAKRTTEKWSKEAGDVCAVRSSTRNIIQLQGARVGRRDIHTEFCWVRVKKRRTWKTYA